jgi:hypothetical protein
MALKRTYYITEELDMALKPRAVRDRMDYSEVVIAALERVKSSATKKKGEMAPSLEIIITGTTITGANNRCNIILFTVCCSKWLLFPKTYKVHPIMGLYIPSAKRAVHCFQASQRS